MTFARLALVTTALIGVAGAISPGAQVPASGREMDAPKSGPTFEVATVRPNNSSEQNASIRIQSGGRLVGTNQTLRNLVRNAWNIQPFQMAGGPDWFERDRFDINAKAAEADLDPNGGLPYPQFLWRLQALLRDRFGLVTHWEARELPVYALVLTRADGRFGPKLRAHSGDCESQVPPGATRVTPNCGTSINAGGGTVKGVGITMATFARNLSGGTGRQVLDKTGLTGAYDLDLEFAPESSPDTSRPSLFAAIPEQLGLKLDPQRAPVDVLVIDAASRPKPD
jgi:uncharacterized protein (TIGR03435 family)